MRAFDAFSIEDGEDIADALVERIGRGIARRVATALATGIEEDEPRLFPLWNELKEIA